MNYIRVAFLLLLPLAGVCACSRLQAHARPEFPQLPWVTKCSGGRCFMRMVVPFEKGRGLEHTALAVSFDQRQKTLEYMSVYVPSDATPASGLLIAFIDSVADGDGWKLVPATDIYAIPIVECTSDSCVARVFPKLDNRDGTSLDLLTELQRRHHMWVLFVRPGQTEPVRVLIPIYGFRDEFAKVQNGSDV